MPTARQKKELPDLARAMASGLGLVLHRSVLYLPVHYDTRQPDVGLPIEDTVWVPQSYQDMLHHAGTMQDSLFQTEADKINFIGMLKQLSVKEDQVTDRVLLSTSEGLRELRGDGQLHEPSLQFTPNSISVPLNDSTEDRQRLFEQFVEWLDSEEDAHSLLHHLATVLAPDWSAAKYVLLIGHGRNGKSLIMKMLVDLLGRANVSHVTRQQMSTKSQECHDLTNKLANVVFDGEATYLKDSGAEKTLTVGEEISIRRLYEYQPTPIRTNGLFVEGLNREPKSSDKSSALQKRIVRFHLPNVYDLNHAFEAEMRSQRMLGALLGLLVEHYVRRDETTVKLAPTRTAIELKHEHSRSNNLALQFVEWVEQTDAGHAESLLDRPMKEVVDRFKSWRLIECNDISTWNEPDVESLLRQLFTSKRMSQRSGTKVHKIRHITGFTSETIEYLGYIREEESAPDAEDTEGTVVEGEAGVLT